MEPSAPEYGHSLVEGAPLDELSLIARFPYASRLKSNDVPSDIEVEEIKAFLHDPTDQVQQMEAEISTLQARLDLLRARHRALKKQVDTCRSLITIPRRLPDDILLEIFFHCLPENNNPTMNGTTAPLLLTAICRRWRILAHQTANLWSGIHIAISDIRNGWSSEEELTARLNQTHQPLYEHLSHWLSRSGMCPLNFSFCMRGVDVADSPLTVTSANYFQRLLPFAPRWRSIFLEGRIYSLSSVLEIPSSHFQSLESLFLDLLGREELPEDMPILNAPLLRKVSIGKTFLQPTSLPLPWARLTHLHLGAGQNGIIAPSVTQLSIVLNLCTSLIYCAVDIAFGSTVHPMYLPKLQRVSIRQSSHPRDAPPGSTFSRAFCEKILAPSLRQINLNGVDAQGFLALVSNNGQHVESLIIDCRNINIAALAGGLRCCPSLISLSIKMLHSSNGTLKIDNTFFSLFIGGGSADYNDPHCPWLKELIFDDIFCETLTGLVSFLHVKQSADPRILSRLVLLAPCSIREDGRIMDEITIMRELKPFTDAGLSLHRFKSRTEKRNYSDDEPLYGSSYIQYAKCWRD